MSDRDKAVAEDSIPLRVIVFLMTILCIGASCAMTRTMWPVTVLSLVLACTGSVVAYQNRYQKIAWMQYVVVVGVLGAGANAVMEFMNPSNNAADFWGPIVHFVACTFALHTFDLKSRADVNLSALLGAMILCFLSPIVSGVAFGGVVMAYICLGTIMLYFDCLSRSRTSWLQKPMASAPQINMSTARRSMRGSAQLGLLILPIVSIFAFLMVPRTDNIIDILMSSLRNMDLSRLQRLLPRLSVPTPDTTPRTPYTMPTRGTNGKGGKAPGADRAISRDTNTDGSVKASAKAEPPKKENPPPKPENKEEKNAVNPEQNKPETKAKPEPKGKGKSEPDKKPGDKTVDKDQKNPKDKKQAGQNTGIRPGAMGSKKDRLADGSPVAGSDGTSSSGGTGGDVKAGGNGSGTNGKDGKSGTGGNKGKSTKGMSWSQILSTELDNAPDLSSNNAVDEILLFRVTSPRLVNLRTRSYDSFDGTRWSSSKAPGSGKHVREQVFQIDALSAAVKADPGKDEEQLSEEEQADQELAEEKLKEMQGDDLGFGPDVDARWIFEKPEKPTFKVTMANPLMVPKMVPTVEVTQSVEATADWDDSIPGGWYPQTVGYFGRNLIVSEDGSIKGSEPIKKGSHYKISSQIPMYDLETMRAAPGISPDREAAIRDRLSNYLQVPDTLSEACVDFANDRVGTTGNWYLQAERLCDAIRNVGTYESHKADDFKAAHDRIAQLIFHYKKGNSKDFATAFTVLARSIGLPARVVTGFNPGKQNTFSGFREITTHDHMTWSEVYIPDYGWVPFDATPNGVMPMLERPHNYSLGSLQKYLEETAGLDDNGPELTPRKAATWFAMGFTVLITLAALGFALWSFLKKLKRDRELALLRGPEGRIYLALMKDLKKARINRFAHETINQYVERLENLSHKGHRSKSPKPANPRKKAEGAPIVVDSMLPVALSDFLDAYEAVHFGKKTNQLDQLQGKADAVRKHLGNRK